MGKESKQLDLMIGRYAGEIDVLPEKRRACVDAISSAFTDAASNYNNAIVKDGWFKLCMMTDLALNPKYVERYKESGDENDCLFLRKCREIDNNLLNRYVMLVHEFIVDTKDFVGEIGMDTEEYAAELQAREEYWGYLMNPDEIVFAGKCIPEKNNPIQNEIFGFDTYASGRYLPAETVYNDGGAIHFPRRVRHQG